MKHHEKLEDINNRHSLALAERGACCPVGSENYNVLSDVAKLIRSEYECLKKGDRHIRHGFRLDVNTGKYRMVILNDHEKN